MRDLISRQSAYATVLAMYVRCDTGDIEDYRDLMCESILALPSVQSEQRCLNCGRTINNGGWYEDGRTRCPIEEHYALPKDGYCHLWEKKKVWEDDYVKSPEEGEK